MRGRSYSYSPSPPRGGYSRRHRSPTPRGRYGGRGRDLPTSLLVQNLNRDCRPEDLRGPFGEFGPLKDVYLPRDYYTGLKEVGFEYILKKFKSRRISTLIKTLTHEREPRGFGFVQYIDPADAAEAKYQMDGQILLGRELTVVFAEENRKKPAEMRAREHFRGPRSYSGSRDYYSASPRRRRLSRSISPRDRRYRERTYSRSRSPYGSRSRSRSRSRSQGRSPSPEGYSR